MNEVEARLVAGSIVQAAQTELIRAHRILDEAGVSPDRKLQEAMSLLLQVKHELFRPGEE